MKAVTSGQMRQIEKIAIEELGIPAIILMENAAIRVAEICLEALAGRVNCGAPAPPKVMISSEGTGIHADSASMSRNTAAYP